MDLLRTDEGPEQLALQEEFATRGVDRREALITRLWQFALIVALVGIWQLSAWQQWLNPTLAKSPAETMRFLGESASTGELWTNGVATMKAVLIAWAIGGVVGTALGLGLGLSRRAERIVTPFIDAANAMPRIALAPVFIIAFGIETEAKVALAVSLVIFIVLSGARAGVHAADPDWLRLSVVLGARKSQMFRKVFLPVALPSIFSALRLGLVYSLLGVVASELISARDGLGQLVSLYSGTFQMQAVYGILLVLACVAVVLNQGTAVIERRLTRWVPPRDH